MRQSLTIILSAVTAFLISLPGAFQLSPLAGLPLIAVFTLIGARIGYKRRHSDAFFYFTLICSVALLSMIMYASLNARQAASAGEIPNAAPPAPLSSDK